MKKWGFFFFFFSERSTSDRFERFITPTEQKLGSCISHVLKIHVTDQSMSTSKNFHGHLGTDLGTYILGR